MNMSIVMNIITNMDMSTIMNMSTVTITITVMTICIEVLEM
jgi:hypothetical protein